MSSTPSPPALHSRHRLRDGRQVELCAIGPDARQDLVAGFQGLSEDSRYRRFFAALRVLPESLLERLLHTDDWSRMAIGARRVAQDGTLEHPIVGVARFARLDDRPDIAETAVAVVDALQGQGLGRLLLETLAGVARERGIEAFRALVLSDNEPMKGLLRSLGADARWEDGYLVYDVPLGVRPGKARAARSASRARRRPHPEHPRARREP